MNEAYGHPLTPPEIEACILETKNRIARGVKVVMEREADYLKAKRELDRAEARATLESEGTVLDRKAHVELAVSAERDASEAAYVLFRHAKEQARALELELNAYQSISASIRSMYAVAGRGEGA